MHCTSVESVFAGKTVSGRGNCIELTRGPLSANCKTPSVTATEIPPKPSPLRPLNRRCVPCSQHIYSTGGTCPSVTLFQRKPQPVRYQQLLFHTPVITRSLQLLLLMSLLLVLLSALSFFISVLRGTLYSPRSVFRPNETALVRCWSVWEA